MSYPRDLEEYSEVELQDELKRRQNARDHGFCDYCGRRFDTPPCKFPWRHYTACPKPVKREKLSRPEGGTP